MEKDNFKIYVQVENIESSTKQQYVIQKAAEVAFSGLQHTNLKELSNENLEKLLVKLNNFIKNTANKIVNGVFEVQNLYEMQVEFGISFTGDIDLIILKAESNSSFKITLKFKKE